jgi:hypothetical protein
MTKGILGLAILAAGLSAPAYAQTARSGGAGSSAGVGQTNGGGGSFGGGFGGGGGGISSVNKLPSYPVVYPKMVGVSGSSSDYVPSTFVPYEKALTEGKTVLDTPAPTVAEAAREQASAHAEKAKFALVQDEYGNPIIVRQ